MASGSNITASGMQTMTQVVAGTDLIDDVDFNNMRTNVARLFSGPQDITLGSGAASAYGWDQGGAGVSAASAGSTITRVGAGGFKDLQDDIQAMCNFLGVALRSGVANDVSTSDTITATTWNNAMLNIRDCWNDRFGPQSRTSSTDGSATRTSAWTNTLTQETTWTFANEADCRQFFNMGGYLGVSASRSGGSSSTQNTQWTNKFNSVSDVWLTHDSVSANAGSTSGKGFYDLTTSYQQLCIYYGGATPYTSDYIQVEARVNSTTNPTVVYFKTTLVDAGDNVIDASVDGTLTINARRAAPDANGSGFSAPVPTDSVGGISGS
jgi:hypothetical protein